MAEWMDKRKMEYDATRMGGYKECMLSYNG